MKDYSVTITITVPFQAASKAQADERAQWLSEAAVGALIHSGKKWLGDVDPATYEVEEA